MDLKKAAWTIPASRIKAGKEHRVPLSPPAVSILKNMQTQREKEAAEANCALADNVFPGGKQGRPSVIWHCSPF